MEQIQGFYDATHIARRLGVKTSEVMRWVNSPTARFPLPIAILLQDNGKDRPIWSRDQVPELRAWLARRLNLSNPAAHWALIDRGGEQPGDHPDQMAMFQATHDGPAESDTLFAVESEVA
jgi:hypothetical protein